MSDLIDLAGIRVLAGPWRVVDGREHGAEGNFCLARKYPPVDGLAEVASLVIGSGHFARCWTPYDHGGRSILDSTFTSRQDALDACDAALRRAGYLAKEATP